MTPGRVRTVTVSLLLFLASPVAAQSSSTGFSHRPWVGTGFGWGNFTAPNSEGSSGLLAASLDLPIVPIAGVRVAAERIWNRARDYGEMSLLQLSADLVTRRTMSTSGTCDMQAVIGLGAGMYRFIVESGSIDDPTRLGYQLTAGADCVGGRLAIGGAFGFRFIDAPDHPVFMGDLVIAASLSLTVRIRL